jgi:mono/diheme cytochrome c family protein
MKTSFFRYTLALAFSAVCSSSYALSIDLPQETASYQPSTLPGYQLVQKNCMICHAAQYVQTQPPSSPRAYWLATVKKMKKPFGAPLPDEDIPDMVDYLVKVYGNERSPAPAK